MSTMVFVRILEIDQKDAFAFTTENLHFVQSSGRIKIDVDLAQDVATTGAKIENTYG